MSPKSTQWSSLSCFVFSSHISTYSCPRSKTFYFVQWTYASYSPCIAMTWTICLMGQDSIDDAYVSVWGMHMWVSGIWGMHKWYLGRPEEGIEVPGAGVTGGCMLPDIGAGNRCQVPWKNIKYCSESLSCLSSTWIVFLRTRTFHTSYLTSECL